MAKRHFKLNLATNIINLSVGREFTTNDAKTSIERFSNLTMFYNKEFTQLFYYLYVLLLAYFNQNYLKGNIKN